MSYSKCEFLWDWSLTCMSKMSSLKQCLNLVKFKTTPPPVHGLSDPGNCSEPRDTDIFQATNDAIETIINIISIVVVLPQRLGKESGKNKITLMNNKERKSVALQFKRGLQGKKWVSWLNRALTCLNQRSGAPDTVILEQGKHLV